MKSNILSAALLLSGANALLTLEKRDNPSVVALPFKRNAGHSALNYRRRGSGEVETALHNEPSLYTVDITLGTPPQRTTVQIDTGSSDLVVETTKSNLCKEDPTVCSGRGAYNANSSSTYHYLNSKLLVAYGDGDRSTGDNALDVLNIGGANIQNFQFGIMYNTTLQEGVLGVGYPGIEGQVGNYGDQPYPNLPSLLVSQGYIESRAYSVYLNDENNAAGGTLLFGGVDTEKYYGDLVTVPFVPAPNETVIDQFYVKLEDVSVTDAHGKVTKCGSPSPKPSSLGPALLDTGTTETLLPASIWSSIFTSLDAKLDGNINTTPNVNVTISCGLVTSKTTIDYVFDGVSIHVPLSQLVEYNDDGTCSLQYELANESDGIILGDTFLSSAYVVFDMDNSQAHLAQAHFNSTKEDIHQITKGKDAVPKLKGEDCDDDNKGGKKERKWVA